MSTEDSVRERVRRTRDTSVPWSLYVPTPPSSPILVEVTEGNRKIFVGLCKRPGSTVVLTKEIHLSSCLGRLCGVQSERSRRDGHQTDGPTRPTPLPFSPFPYPRPSPSLGIIDTVFYALDTVGARETVGSETVLVKTSPRSREQE